MVHGPVCYTAKAHPVVAYRVPDLADGAAVLRLCEWAASLGSGWAYSNDRSLLLFEGEAEIGPLGEGEWVVHGYERWLTVWSDSHFQERFC